MYQQLKLNDLDTANIQHVVGASGKSLGARGRTRCKININGEPSIKHSLYVNI